SYTSLNPTGSLSYTPVANASGTATVTVTVNDGQSTNNITTQSFTVTVNPVNDVPENLKGGNPIGSGNNTVVAPQATFTFSGSNELSVRDADAGNISVTLSVPT